MHHYSVSDEATIVARAKQGDPEAIAAMMNYFFNSRGIRVSVTWKPKVLLMLLEASEAPTQDETLPPIHRAIKRLGLESIEEIRVYARHQGGDIAWQAKLGCGAESLAHTQSPMTHPLSLISWLNQGGDGTQYPALSPPSEIEPPMRFLRFYLNHHDTALVPLDEIQSIFQITPQQILPVPNVSDCVLGIYHYRGTLVWLIDLGQQIGSDSCLSMSDGAGALTAIAIPVGQDLFALVVPRIATVETHASTLLKPVDLALFSPKLLPFIQSYIASSVSPVLSPQAVLQKVYPQGHLH